MISRRTYVFSALALAAILFVGLNIFADNFFTNARLDLTQNGQFTLSRGTRNILAKLKEPVTLQILLFAHLRRALRLDRSLCQAGARSVWANMWRSPMAS